MADRLVQAAAVILDLAQKLSSWSERIPRSGHLVGNDPVVLIVMGGPPAPHAITFEAPGAPYWKHPVFGHGPREDWHWVAQPPRRFLSYAAEQGADKAVEVYARVVDDWAEELGFHPE